MRPFAHGTEVHQFVSVRERDAAQREDDDADFAVETPGVAAHRSDEWSERRALFRSDPSGLRHRRRARKANP
jgi:hypothetical protein